MHKHDDVSNFDNDLQQLVLILEPLACPCKCLESSEATAGNMYFFWLAVLATYEQLFMMWMASSYLKMLLIKFGNSLMHAGKSWQLAPARVVIYLYFFLIPISLPPFTSQLLTFFRIHYSYFQNVRPHLQKKHTMLDIVRAYNFKFQQSLQLILLSCHNLSQWGGTYWRNTRRWLCECPRKMSVTRRFIATQGSASDHCDTCGRPTRRQGKLWEYQCILVNLTH